MLLAVPRIDVQTWSIDNGFELVELHPTDETDDEVEDSFQESNSFKRILEALAAHTWPELTMKCEYKRFRCMRCNVATLATPSYKPSEKFRTVLDEKSVVDEMKRLGVDSGNDTNNVAVPVENLSELAQNLEDGSFEELFSRFQDIKSK